MEVFFLFCLFFYFLCRIARMQRRSMQAPGCRSSRSLCTQLSRCVRAEMSKDCTRRLALAKSKVCVARVHLCVVQSINLTASFGMVLVKWTNTANNIHPVIDFTFVARFHWDWLRIRASRQSRAGPEDWRAHGGWMSQASPGAAQGWGGWDDWFPSLVIQQYNYQIHIIMWICLPQSTMCKCRQTVPFQRNSLSTFEQIDYVRRLRHGWFGAAWPA